MVLQPGDTLQTTCSFHNDLGYSVAFGDTTLSPRCYLQTYAYPVGALASETPSLLGARNTCW
ncbi:MAG: hypothetical protein OXU20_20555 [Myxococcales bacterium]|nr:hypothetical protein [Myxococcales bacterium]MDD9968480.1 hypothetical protein [Myxococcales bacterium]